MKNATTIGIATAMLAAVSGACVARAQAPASPAMSGLGASQQVPTAGSLPEHADFHLRYAVYVHGLHAIELDAAVRLDGDHFDVSASDHMVGFASAFLSSHVASHVSGSFIHDIARPVRYASAGFSRGADRQTVIDYPDGNPVVRVLTPVEPARDKVPAADTAGAIDTLSAVTFLLREAASTGRCDGTLHVFDGARLSVLTSVTAGMQPVAPSDRSPYDGPALRCDVDSREIAGFLHDANFEASHHPQTGSVWLARVVPNGPPVPIAGTFSTVDHGPVSIYLLGVS